jgi:hypothetical protein
MLKRILILRERLLRIERGVEVRESNLSNHVIRELGQCREAVQPIQRIASDQQIVRGAAR